MSDTLTTKQLCELLAIDRRQLDKWIRQGLPKGKNGRNREFDPVAVSDWLVENGHAEPEQPAQRILTTRDEVADHFQVSTRTVGTWLKQPGFPGKSGRAFDGAGGSFPVDEIQQWLDDRDQRTATGSKVNEQLTQERLRRLRIANDEAEGMLVDVEEARRLQVRTSALARNILYQLVPSIPLLLPSDVPQIVKNEVRIAVEKKLDQVCAVLAQAIENDDDPDLHLDPDGSDA